MQARDFATQTMRSVRSKPLESVLIVFVIALSVGVEASMLALILNGAEQGRALSQSPQARELVMVNANNDFQSFFTATGINPVIKIAAGKPPDTFDQTELQATLRACPALQYGYLADPDSFSLPSPKGNAAQSESMRMIAVTNSYIEATKLELLAGAWPSGTDFRDRLPVIAVSELFVRQRFEKTQPKTAAAEKSLQAASNAGPKPPIDLQAINLRDVIGKTIYTENHVSYKIVAVFATPENVTRNWGFQFVNKNQRDGAYGILPWGREDNTFHNLTDLKFVAFPDQLEAAQEQDRKSVV